MIVAVFGGSHGGYATAADLALAGHRVRLWRRSERDLRAVVEAGGLTLGGQGRSGQARLERITADVREAVEGAEVVVVPLPATAHEDVAARLAPWLDDRKLVVFTPGALGSYVVAREIARPGGTLPFAFAETGTLPYLARKTGPASVTIAARAVSLPVGVFPASRTRETLDRIRELFPAARPRVDVLDAALTNPGPVMHPPLVLLNLGAIDRGKFDIYGQGTTPNVRGLIAAVDAERVESRKRWGFPAPHYELATYYDETHAAEGFFGISAHSRLVSSGLWDELLSLDHRYVAEDVALGLSLLESAARTTSVDSPATSGLLAVFGVLVERRLSGAGRSLEHLGLGDLTLREIRSLFQEGWESPVWGRVIK